MEEEVEDGDAAVVEAVVEEVVEEVTKVKNDQVHLTVLAEKEKPSRAAMIKLAADIRQFNQNSEP